MARLNMALLGAPVIDLDGDPIDVDTRKAIALLAYLAVTGERRRRDTLAALFWPDADDSRARTALRRTLSTLNAALGGHWLDISRQSIAFVPDEDVSFDVPEFLARVREDAAEAALREAVELYRDDFMAGFALRDSPEFDDWQYFQAEGLRRDLARALERLVVVHSSRGEFELAVQYGRRWVALDPLHEPAHRWLMQAYAWIGDRSSALRQYRECVRVLQEELGVDPLDATTDLHDSIKGHQELPPPPLYPALSPASPPTLAASNPRGVPLVGRETELAVALEAWSAVGPHGRLCVIEGEAGVGKTRLVEELIAGVRARGGQVLLARCFEGEVGLAYGPLVEILRQAVERLQTVGRLDELPEHVRREVGRLVPDLIAPGGPVASDLSNVPVPQLQVFESVVQVIIAALTGPVGGVLVLEDIHWMDRSSLDLLAYLGRRLQNRPIFVLVTFRGEQVPEEHLLRHLLTEAARTGVVSHVLVERLSREAVRELVHELEGAALEPEQLERLSERLFVESEGLPFLVLEYLSASRQDGILTDTRWALPPGARALLRSRLAGIDDTARRLLARAAVVGHSVDYELLRDLDGRSDDETIVSLEMLVAHRLLVESVARSDVDVRPEYFFSHEKVRELIYNEMTLARQRLLHRRVADVLVARAGHGEPDGTLAPRIARHYERGGQVEDAARYYAMAGDYAREMLAHRDAIAHYQAALALGHPEIDRLHGAIGDINMALGEYGPALDSYTSAIERGEGAILAELEHKLGRVYQRLGDTDNAERHFALALGCAEERCDRLLYASILADWSLTAMRVSDATRAIGLAQQAIDLATLAGDARTAARAHAVRGILERNRGDLTAAREEFDASLKLLTSADDPLVRISIMNSLALIHSEMGDNEKAIESIQAAIPQAKRYGVRHEEAALYSNLADLMQKSGREDEAMAHLKHAATIYAEIGVVAGELQPEIWKLIEW